MKTALFLCALVGSGFAGTNGWHRLPARPSSILYNLQSFPGGIRAIHYPFDTKCRARGESGWAACTGNFPASDSSVEPLSFPMDNLEKGGVTNLPTGKDGKPRTILALLDTISSKRTSLCTPLKVVDHPSALLAYWNCTGDLAGMYQATDALDSAGKPVLVWRHRPEFDQAALYDDARRFGDNLFFHISDSQTLQIRTGDTSWKTLPQGMDMITSTGDTIAMLSLGQRRIFASLDGGRSWSRRSLVDQNLRTIRFEGGILWGGFEAGGTTLSELWRSEDLGTSWRKSIPQWGSLAFDGDRFLLSTPAGLHEATLSDNSWRILPDTILPEQAGRMESFQGGFLVGGTGLQLWKDGAWRSLLDTMNGFASFHGGIVALQRRKVLRYEGSIWDSVALVPYPSSNPPRVACQDPWGCIVSDPDSLLFSRDGRSWIRTKLPAGFQDSNAPFGFSDSGRLLLHSLGGYMVGGLPYNMKLVDSTWVRTDETPLRRLFDPASKVDISKLARENLSWTDSTVSLDGLTLGAKDLPGRVVSAAWVTVGNPPGADAGIDDTTLVVEDGWGTLWARQTRRTNTRVESARDIRHARILGRDLVVELESPATVRIDFFDASGRQEALLPPTRTLSGRIRLPLPKSAALGFLRVSVDGESSTIAVAPRLGGR